MKVMVGVCLAAATIFAAVGLAGAQAPGGGPGSPGGGPGFGEHRPPFERALGPQGKQGRWWNDPAMVQKLGLSDAQRKSMDDILLQHRETLIDLRANLEKGELALEPLMRDDQPNESQILAQIDKVAQARAELEKANARFLLAIRGKLTPEQWKQLQAERASRREQKHEWGPGRQGRPQAPPPAPDAQGSGPQSRMDDAPEEPGAPEAGVNN